jgi:hypothetical protein
MPLLHESIARIPEKDLVAHVLNDVHYRDTLLNIKGITTKDARILEQIELRHFRKDITGEINILVVPNCQPEQSTAIQVKRFKAEVALDEQGYDDANIGHPLRFQELIAKGVLQANETKRVGFAQVYLWIFVAIDTRQRNSGWYTYEVADSVLNSQIRHRSYDACVLAFQSFRSDCQRRTLTTGHHHAHRAERNIPPCSRRAATVTWAGELEQHAIRRHIAPALPVGQGRRQGGRNPSIACFKMRTYSMRAAKLDGRSSRPIWLPTRGRSRTHWSQSPGNLPVLRCPQITGFQLSTEA